MNKIEETIETMYVILSDIKKAAEERMELVDEASKEEIKQLFERTRLVMYKSIEKVKEISNDLSTNEELEIFFNNIISKCNEVKAFTIEKIKNTGKVNSQNLHKVELDINNLLEEFKEHEAYKTVSQTYENIKQNVQDFLAKPEVQEKIGQIKDKTLDIADKGLDILKKTLKPEEYNDKNKPQE